jgi:hypothetical protein
MLASSELIAALRAVDATFEKRLEKLATLCSCCTFSKHEEPEVAKRFERFDAIVRQHRRRRLELPVRAVWDESFGHGSALVHASARRLAWFVPSILAASLDGGDFVEVMRRLGEAACEAWVGEHAYHKASPRDFTQAERGALGAFLRTALQLIATGESHAVAEVAAIFGAAAACGCDREPLASVLVSAPLAERALLDAVTAAHDADPTWTPGSDRPYDIERLARETGRAQWGVVALRVLREAIFTEETRRQLEARVLAESGEAASALSRAEGIVCAGLGGRGSR